MTYQTLKCYDWYLQDKHASHAYTHVTPVFVLFFVFHLFIAVPGIEPRALHMPGGYLTTDLQPRLHILSVSVSNFG